IGASGIEATVSLAGQTAGIIDGRLGLVVPLPAPALSASPGGSPVDEGIAGINDNNPATKYLNYAGPGTGFTTALPQAKALNSLLLTSRTNDDIWQWDPKTWEVWGSNNSVDWGDTSWTKLGAGDTLLGDARGSQSVVSFANDTPYRFYKVVFPTTKGISQGKAYMHLAEALLFAAPAGTVNGSPGSSPNNELVGNVIDGNPATKYLNTTGPGSGFTFTLPTEQVLDALSLTTRTNDNIWQWDPKTWQVWGSNDSAVWDATTWTQLGEGATGLANGRGASSVVAFNNTTAYKFYKVVFPTTKGVFTGKSYMHVADAKLFKRPPAGATGTLPGEGFAFTLDATAKVPIPFINESLYGDISIGANFTGAPVDQAVKVSGQTIDVSFKADGETRFALSNLDGSLGGQIGGALRTIASQMSGLRSDLINAEPLPIINQTLDEILNISPYLRVGDDVLAYLNKPASFFGVKGVPTVRGLQAYLEWANSDRAGPTVTAVTASSTRSPNGEGAAAAIDGSPSSKYLNYGKEGSGLVMTLSEAAIVDSISLTTASDNPERDPLEISIYASNSATAPAWGSTGWVEIATDVETGLTTARNASRSVNFANTTRYQHYKIVFTKLRDTFRANSVQVAEINPFPQKGLVFNLDDKGLKFGLKAAIGAKVEDLKLDIGSQLGGIGLELEGDLLFDANFSAALDFDLNIGWSKGFSASFNLNDLSFSGALSARDVVLKASLGPIALSIGREGDAEPAQRDAQGNITKPAVPWARGLLDAAIGGRMAWQNGVFTLKPTASRFNLELPLYASVAGFDLVASGSAVPTAKLTGDPLAGKFDFKTENFDQLSNISRMSITDLLLALPGILSYLESVSAESLGIGDLPFVSQGVDQLLDLAGVFKRTVVDKVDTYRPIKLWTAAANERAAASGTASIPNGVRSTLVGSAGQFAKSMAGYWITLSGANGGWLTPTQIVSVSADGSTLTLRDSYSTGRTGVQYKVHERRENIRTIDEFVAAFNEAFKDSRILGTITYNAETGDLRIPLRLRERLVGIDTPIDLGFGEDQPISLSTSAHGKLDVDVDAGFDLILALGGERFQIALDDVRANADVLLDVSDLEVTAKLGFVGLKAGGAGTGTGVRLDAGVHFALDRDPSKQTAGDSRFTLTELASSEALNAIRFNVDGDARASIRGLSLVGGKDASFSIAPDLELALIVPDLSRFGEVKLVQSTPTLLSRFDGAGKLERKQTTELPLSGQFKAGDVLRLGDVSAADIVYKVTAADVAAASAETPLAAVLAGRLATAVAAAQGARVTAVADGAMLRLTSTVLGSAGGFNVTPTVVRTVGSTGVIGERNVGFDRAAALTGGLIGASDVVVALPDVGSLFDLSRLTFADIVSGLRFALSTIDDVVGEQPFYNQTLPILDRSLGELLDLGDVFLGRIEAAGNTPAAALDAVEAIIEEALGISPDLFDLTLGATQLIIDVNLEAAYSADFALNLKLADLIGMALPNVAIPDALYKLVDSSGEAKIALKVGAALDLQVGIGLPGTSAPAVELIDYDPATGKGTRVKLDARLVADDIDLRLKAGPFDIGIDSGRVVFDADGRLAEAAPATAAAPEEGAAPEAAAAAQAATESVVVDAPASLTVSLKNGAPEIVAEGGFSINLPLTFVVGSRTIKLGELSIGTNPAYGNRGLEAFVREVANNSAFPRLEVNGKVESALQVKLPDFDVFNAKPPSLLEVLYDPTPVLDGVDFALGSVQDVFENTLVANLPLIGDKLSQLGGMIAELRNGLLGDLRARLSEPGKTVEIMRTTLYQVFGERLGILRDANGDKLVTLSDISIDFYDIEGKRLAAWVPGAEMPREADSIRIDMDLGGRVLGTGIDIPLDLNLPGFELKVDGGFALELQWAYDFGFGLSVADGFFLSTNADATPELRLDALAYLDGSPKDPTVITPFAGSGKLLFFSAAVTDRDLDPDAAGFQPSGLRAQLGIDIKGNVKQSRLTLSDLMSNPSAVLGVTFTADADMRLGVELSALGLPALKADLVVGWDWSLADKALRFPTIAIENLRLDFRSAVTDFLLPIANTIADTVSPFRDIVYALTQPVPGMELFTDTPRKALGLAPDPTLRGLIDVINELVRKTRPSLNLPRINWAFLDAVKFALDMPDQIRTLLSLGAGLPLGSIYGLGTSDVRFVSNFKMPDAGSKDNAVFSAISSLSALAVGSTVTAKESSGLQFMPYLLDIGNWAKIFSGGNATLFTYELPILEFEMVFEQMLAPIPIPFPPLSWLSINVGAIGRARAYIDLSFGVDTYGVQKALQTGNLFDVADSFYINDWTLPTIRNGAIVAGTGGKEKPEFGIDLEIGLLGGVGITGVVSGGIGGSITMKVDADLNDIKRGTVVRDENGQVSSVSYKGDGRIRLSEVATMMLYPGVIPFTNISTGIPGGPLNLFDLTFRGGISPYIWIDTIATGTMAFKLFTIWLPSVTMEAPTVKPTLAQMNNGVLTLNAGPRAADRLWVNTADGGEKFILSGTGGGVIDVEFDSFVVRYSGVSKVVVDLGEGDDTFDATRLLDKTVTFDVRGGDGDDTILFGTGGGTAVDLTGSNQLDASRSQVPVTLVGGAGDDTLTGGLADDVLLGGLGTNTLGGGAGDDTLTGGLADDVL
ncbi:MAG: discoidin domain-containing protein, partial [Betaproteobacteria bacterium]|nr:discoidin domain-containing protein [Betaproteobacteria bacterium]